MSDLSILDRPAWAALTTRQAGRAVGGSAAVRFDRDYAPFGAAADGGESSQAALAELIAATGPVVVIEPDPPAAPPATRRVSCVLAHQMVLDDLASPADDHDMVALAEADAPDMLALARLTQPGPFSVRTHQLGDFFGVRRHGVLVAMAGERMRPEGFTEISGVCTHPDHRGRGFAAALTGHVAARVQSRGEGAFLHVLTANVGAIRVYQGLGFRVRRTLSIAVLAHRGGSARETAAAKPH